MNAQVEVLAEGAGHKVPTGFVDRHLLLVVQAEDAMGRPLAALAGPRLPTLAGKPLAGKPGKIYAKLLKDADGNRPAPFWNADPEPEDTRLIPGRPNRSFYLFPASTCQVRIRVLYRRYWHEVAVTKGWEDNEIAVDEQTVECRE